MTVSGQAPVVETTSNAVASVVTQEQIESLPIANRQPISLALLLPGTSMDTTSVRRSQAIVGAGGSANTMNLYYVDGGMNMSNNSGQQHLEVPQSAIREFRVNISQSSAEYGAVGGVVLTATKSGTNRFSGEAFEFFRDKSLNAMDKLQKERHDRFGDPKPDYPAPLVWRRTWRSHHPRSPALLRRVRTFDQGAQDRDGQYRPAAVLLGARRQLSGRGTSGARGSCAATSRSTRSRTCSSDMSRTWSDVCAKTCGGFNAAFSGADTALAARLEPGRPHVGDQLADAERGPGADPAVAPGQPHGPPGTAASGPRAGRVSSRPSDSQGYTPIYQFPSLNWGSNGWSINWTNRWEIRDDFSITMGNHDLKIGGGYVRLLLAGGAGEQHRHLDVRTRTSSSTARPRQPGEPAGPDSVHGVVPAAPAALAEPLDPGVRAGRVARAART